MKHALTAAIILAAGTTALAEEYGTDRTLLASTLSLAQTDPADVAEAAHAAPPSAAYDAGSWTVQAYGSATFGDNSREVYLGHIGFGYYIWDALSINVEAVVGGFNSSDQSSASGQDGAAAGFDLLARWHFYRGENWSIYADGGTGVIQTQYAFPADGTHFNFTPQVGMGVTVRLTDSMRLMTGARWHHISNARKSGRDENPGYDGAMIYAGLMFSF